ncbi:hypothetical protein ColLi_06993 [Colletotrichum liriopes]|uniref:Uncharacterized protein n=1 Tax=Colletotrichum liriopes TaxID=708192 RepID=A0AA37GNE6_9PEZI|nr:hypothetical protein ColLi_06993 [Colletotrichum liriopes]
MSLAHVLSPSPLSEKPNVTNVVEFTPLPHDGTAFAHSRESPKCTSDPVVYLVAGPPAIEERDVKMPAQFVNVVQEKTNRSRSQAHHVDTLERGLAALSRTFQSHFPVFLLRYFTSLHTP